MKYSSMLAATVAAGALMGVSAPVQAKVVKHRAASPAAGSQAAEIRALRAELQELKARLDARDAQLATAPAPAPSTEAQAAITQAQTQAAAAQTQAATAQATAEKASKDTGALAKAVAWAKDTTISGRMYFNSSYIDHKSNGVRGALGDNGGGFAIKRFYVGVDHKFNDMFSANLTMDVDNLIRASTPQTTSLATTGTAPAGGGAITGGSTAITGTVQGFYIKKAFLQAKLDPAFIIRLGAADTPWIPYVENVYGYRHIEQTLTDRAKFGTSSDWGVHVLGDLMGGVVSYQFSAVNGAGYRVPKQVQTIDLEGRISAKYKGFEAAIGGYVGKMGADTQTGSPIPQLLAKRLNALIAYKGKISEMPVTIGGEYVYAEDKNPTGFSAATVHDKGDGYSAFASVGFMPKWSVFGRYDTFKSSEIVAYGFKDNYLNAGLQWSPAKIVDLALVYKHETARGGTITPGNLQYGLGCGTGVNAASVTCGRGTWDEFGLYGQFRF